MVGDDMPQGLERRGMNIVEGLVLAAILALVGSSLYQAKAMVELQTTVTYLRTDMASLRASLADMQILSQRVSRIEVKQDNVVEEMKELRANRGLR